MTHDQHIASDPAISAWVSASAGTGKTRVLTDRVLRLLLAGVAPEKILCITYTRAASAEMEGRISTSLARWVTLEDSALRDSLAELTGSAPNAKTLTRARRLFAEVLDSPERIRIQTIHSFCQSVLARFPLEADVPPHFMLIDDNTSRELLAEARARLFADAIKPENQEYAEAIGEISAHISESSFVELLEQIIAQRRRFAEVPTDICRLHEALGLATDADEQGLFQRHLRYTHDEERDLKQACEVLSGLTVKADLQTFEGLSLWLEKREDIEAYLPTYLTQKNTPRKTIFTKEFGKAWPQLAAALSDEQQRIIRYFEERQSLRIAQISRHVAVLAAAMLEIYREQKARHHYLDYDDLILHTVRLLEKKGVAPWVLFKLDGGIDHLLIDEAQDTAPEQWRIVDALAVEFFAGEGARSSKRTLFVVGDEKQSIFSFQGADPHEFDRMQGKFSKLATGAAKDFKRVRLALSFRSTAPVLAAVDAVFAAEDARDGLVFTESDIRHEVHRLGVKGRVELWPLIEADEEDALPQWHIPDASSYSKAPHWVCAEQIAGTISGWLKEGGVLASGGRPIRPGDIMILVQRRGVFAGAMLRALKRKGVAVAGADRLVLTEHIAVMDCMALARFLLLPQDDLSLAEVLKSPFVGLSEEALFELAYNRGDKSLWQQLKESSQSTSCLKRNAQDLRQSTLALDPAVKLQDDELRKNDFEQAYIFLSDLLAQTDYLAPYELFAHVLEANDGRRKLYQRLGNEIDDPLNEFLALALDYGRTHPPSLQGFLHWLETGATEIKRDMEKGRDEVRILTVHGAKGLEAPVVFLPDTTRMPKHKNEILWMEDSIALWSPGQAYDDKHCRTLKEARRVDAEREYRRLLYVAMTRAEDELYICGWKGSKAISEGCWYELVRRAAQNWGAEEGKLVLHSEQTAVVKASPPAQMQPAPKSLPSWAHEMAAAEPVPGRPLAPSRLQPVPQGFSPFADTARERGILVHRLLQYLPDVAKAQRDEVMERFIARYGAALSEQERGQIAKEVIAILEHPEFSVVFGAGSVAEASIAGVAGGVSIAGRIDRLAVCENDVFIVDYKTGSSIPVHESDVPAAYLQQMDAYRKLVAKIYPDKTVHCALLWTAAPKLIALSEKIMQSLAA